MRINSGEICVDVGRVTKHLSRLIMEGHLGRPLDAKEYVHHIDGDILNNDIENLQIMSPQEHSRLHNLGKAPMLGKYHSKETREKMSQSAKEDWERRRQEGYKVPPFSEEHKRKISGGVTEAWKRRLQND